MVGMILLLLAEAVVLWGIWYVTMPVISVGFVGGFFFIAFALILVCSTIGFFAFKGEYMKAFFGIPTAISVLVLVIGSLAGSSLFNSTVMYNQIGEFEVRDFKTDVLEIDTTQIPTVDIALARRVADKKLGEELALGSQYEIGKISNKQQVNGKLVYVAPLEYRDFFKWYSNRLSGCPGYVIVNATNPNDVQLVLNLDGENMHMKYMGKACFSNQIERHIRKSGFSNVGLTEFSFELDDDGRPY